MREDKTDITLTSIVNVNDTIVNVSAGHGFAIGDWIVIFDNNRYLQSKVINVNTNAITIQNASSYAFSLTSSIILGSIEINVEEA